MASLKWLHLNALALERALPRLLGLVEQLFAVGELNVSNAVSSVAAGLDITAFDALE